MANEVTVFQPMFEDALYQAFDPIRLFAKQDPVGAGAKTVSIPVSGGITFADITATDWTYPRDAGDRTDTATTYDLTKIEVNPFRIGKWDEFVQNANLRESIFGEVAGVLGNYAIRQIMNGFWNGDTGFEFVTTGTNTYTNRHGEATCKSLTIADVAGLAKKMDLQGVPRDGQRYLVLDPDMYVGFLLELAAIGYEDTVTKAFATQELPEIHGFKIVRLQQVNHVTASNAAVQTPGTASSATHLNAGLALHKNFVGFGASNVNLFLQMDSPEYYGSVISGDFYAGGSYRRATPIGCLTIYEGA